jgi:RNA polymerase sigma factor (TIGR02999 family)
LEGWQRGEPGAKDAVWASVYPDLRVLARRFLARERHRVTIETTDLAHEVFLRLARQRVPPAGPQQLRQALARNLRLVLVDMARRRRARRRSLHVTLGARSSRAHQPSSLDVLDLHAALVELEREHALASRVVELRVFGGATVSEAADELAISPRTVDRLWRFGRAFLYERLHT